MSLSSEFEFISKILPVARNSHNEQVLLANGDDAAVLKIGDAQVAVSVDTIVENRHFSFSYFAPEQVGKKAVESAVSDLIAVGAVPCGLVVSLSLPASIEESFLLKIYQGIENACKRLNITLLGGDTVGNASGVELAVTALGQVKQNILKRSNAKVGEYICVSGELGGSYAGLKAIQAGLKDYKYVRMKHLEPLCRIDLVGKLYKLHAAIDISDGLSSEVWHICSASQCGAIIYKNKIPLNSEVRRLASYFQEDPVDYALIGGEDYEILFTVEPENFDASLGTIIGVCTPSNSVVLQDGNEQIELMAHGYDHFVSSGANIGIIS